MGCFIYKNIFLKQQLDKLCLTPALQCCQQHHHRCHFIREGGMGRQETMWKFFLHHGTEFWRNFLIHGCSPILVKHWQTHRKVQTTAVFVLQNSTCGDTSFPDHVPYELWPVYAEHCLLHWRQYKMCQGGVNQIAYVKLYSKVLVLLFIEKRESHFLVSY